MNQTTMTDTRWLEPMTTACNAQIALARDIASSVLTAVERMEQLRLSAWRTSLDDQYRAAGSLFAGQLDPSVRPDESSSTHTAEQVAAWQQQTAGALFEMNAALAQAYRNYVAMATEVLGSYAKLATEPLGQPTIQTPAWLSSTLQPWQTASARFWDSFRDSTVAAEDSGSPTAPPPGRHQTSASSRAAADAASTVASPGA